MLWCFIYSHVDSKSYLACPWYDERQKKYNPTLWFFCSKSKWWFHWWWNYQNMSIENVKYHQRKSSRMLMKVCREEKCRTIADKSMFFFCRANRSNGKLYCSLDHRWRTSQSFFVDYCPFFVSFSLVTCLNHFSLAHCEIDRMAIQEIRYLLNIKYFLFYSVINFMV